MSACIVYIDNIYPVKPFYNKMMASHYSKNININVDEKNKTFLCRIKSKTNEPEFDFEGNFKCIVVVKVSENDSSKLQICDSSCVFKPYLLPIEYLDNGILERI